MVYKVSGDFQAMEFFVGGGGFFFGREELKSERERRLRVSLKYILSIEYDHGHHAVRSVLEVDIKNSVTSEEVRNHHRRRRIGKSAK